MGTKFDLSMPFKCRICPSQVTVSLWERVVACVRIWGARENAFTHAQKLLAPLLYTVL